MTAIFALSLTLLAAQWSLVLSSNTIRGLNTTFLPLNTTKLLLNTTKLDYDPRPAPAYMVDNQHNYYKIAPNKSRQNSPVWAYSNSLDTYLTNLQSSVVLRSGYTGSNDTKRTSFTSTERKRQQSSSFWLLSLGSLGSGAIVYFPGGTYKICTLVIQYYYTQFVGDSNDMPIIKGCDEFQSIAMFDVDLYIPGGSSQQYIFTENGSGGGSIAFNISGVGGDSGQGIGSKRYNGAESSTQTGAVTAPERGKGLDNANSFLFVRSRPQYEKNTVGSFLIATTDRGCENDATGDQASCINTFLRQALDSGKIAYFPAGVYTVKSTVNIPTNPVVQSFLWSQILGSGFYFSDMKKLKVIVQVGNKSDIGTIEITKMLFSVRSATAGAILIEWNVTAVSLEKAAM
ncbi:hypothetical protein B0O99DRAFT_673724 [Bisporella sp. PMI_857]|nr:hypothetical protein B0O99DRAFT_673724 [Bisporella sp. PMI_857]